MEWASEKQRLNYCAASIMGKVTLIRPDYDGVHVVGKSNYFNPASIAADAFILLHYLHVYINNHPRPWDDTPQTLRDEWEAYSASFGHTSIADSCMTLVKLVAAIAEHAGLVNLEGTKL